MTKIKISTKVEGVTCVIGQTTRKNNTITMRCPEDNIVDAVKFFKDSKSMAKPEKGLIQYELYACYIDEAPEKEQAEFIETGEEVIGDELIDGAKAGTHAPGESPLYVAGTGNGAAKEAEAVLTTRVLDQDKANKAFEEMDEALGITLEEGAI